MVVVVLAIVVVIEVGREMRRRIERERWLGRGLYRERDRGRLDS